MNDKLINNKRIQEICIVLLFCALPLLLYRDILFNGSIMISGDGVLNYIIKTFFSNGIANGYIPLWNRYLLSGLPFMSDIQNGFFYPLNIIYLFFKPNDATNLFYLVHLSLAGYFTYLYSKEIYKDRFIAVIVGIIFMFATILGGPRKNHINIVSTITWLPLILFTLEKYKNTKDARWLLGTSISMAIQFFSGFPQSALYSNMAVFAYFIYVHVDQKIDMRTLVKNTFKWLGLYVLLISIQLVPLGELIIQSGRARVPYDFFSFYSYDLRLILMSIIPNLYNNLYAPFGEYASSGIDNEIYIGIIAFIFFLFAIRNYFNKDKFVKSASLISGFFFIYGMAGNIPLIGKIIWKIPVLGSFRVCARALFIVIFFEIILFGYTLTKLKFEDDIKGLIKYCERWLVIVISISFALFSVMTQPNTPEALKAKYGTLSQVYVIPVVIIILMIIMLKILLKSRKEIIRTGIVLIIATIILVDVGRYSIVHAKFNYEADAAIKPNSELESILKDKENIPYRSWGLIDSPEKLFDNNLDFVKSNYGMFNQYMTLNAYITFNDKKMAHYFPDTQMFVTQNELLTKNNDFLSMLSVKYLFDSWDSVSKLNINNYTTGKVIYEKKDILIDTKAEELFVSADEIKLEPNSKYRVTLDINFEEVPAIFYVDFYSSNYDNPMQDGLFEKIGPSKQSYSIIIDTDGEKLPENTYFRIISKSGKNIKIRSVQVEKLEIQEDSTVYKKILSFDNTVVYENLNAKPLLYIPNKVINSDGSYEAIENKDKDKVAYVTGLESEINNYDQNAVISNLEIKDNSVSAKITSKGNTFVNHTQLMYPGWKVFIDGKEVENYTVNNLIQGTVVSEGEHVILFIYNPMSLKIGFGVTLIGIILVLLSLRKNKYSKVNN